MNENTHPKYRSPELADCIASLLSSNPQQRTHASFHLVTSGSDGDVLRVKVGVTPACKDVAHGHSPCPGTDTDSDQSTTACTSCARVESPGDTFIDRDSTSNGDQS